MLKIENTDVFGLEAAIRGMRNPKNSWEKSDSNYCLSRSFYDLDCENCKLRGRACDCTNTLIIGPNDMKLAMLLAKSGTDDGKFLRMIHVQCDVTAPLYWWKEADQYKIGTVTDSCSTMHKIHAKEFTLDDFSYEHLSETAFAITDEFVESYKDVLVDIVKALNAARTLFLETQDKTCWWQMIQLLPSSYNQKRTYDLNYAVLRNMYHARKNHKLDEWHTFCAWIESLPYSELITEK